VVDPGGQDPEEGNTFPEPLQHGWEVARLSESSTPVTEQRPYQPQAWPPALPQLTVLCVPPIPPAAGCRAGKNEAQHSGGGIQEELEVCPAGHGGGLH
jgi:hypothetical protein